MMKDRPMNAVYTDIQRRESRRFPGVVPIEVSWRGPNGMALNEDAVARHVNDKRGPLEMASRKNALDGLPFLYNRSTTNQTYETPPEN
jgi:hypothetical protein